MTDIVWKYLPKGKVSHALDVSRPGIIAAECGVYTFGWWHGTGTQDEYDKAATLPPCKRCAAKFNLAARGRAVPSGIRRTTKPMDSAGEPGPFEGGGDGRQ